MWQNLFSDNDIKNIAKQFITENKTDVVDLRKFAKENAISKSTLHLNLKTRLKDIDYNLWLEYLTIANRNKFLGNMKGGKALKPRKEKNKK